MFPAAACFLAVNFLQDDVCAATSVGDYTNTDSINAMEIEAAELFTQKSKLMLKQTG